MGSYYNYQEMHCLLQERKSADYECAAHERLCKQAKRGKPDHRSQLLRKIARTLLALGGFLKSIAERETVLNS